MDYLDQVTIMRHASWDDFDDWRRRDGARLILFTTRASVSYLDHAYRRDDVLLFGRESAGVPDRVHDAADARLIIPIRPGLRSLNVAVACAMALGEAMRQTRDALTLRRYERRHERAVGMQPAHATSRDSPRDSRRDILISF